MRDIATTTLSGNLTRDVELRQLPSGADVARLRVATTTRRRSGEEWVERGSLSKSGCPAVAARSRTRTKPHPLDTARLPQRVL